MAGESGREWSLPLLPAGISVFESLPMRALVLDALAPVVGNGMITLSDHECEGVLVVRDGRVAEQVWVAGGARSHGDEALALIRSADTALVSARRLSDEAMGLLAPLLQGVPYYADLRLEWVAWRQFLSELCERGGAFVVDVTAPSGRGVTYIRDGRQVATFTESHPSLGDAALLDDIAAEGVGTIRVLVENVATEQQGSVVTPVVATSIAGSQEPEVPAAVAPYPDPAPPVLPWEAAGPAAPGSAPAGLRAAFDRDSDAPGHVLSLGTAGMATPGTSRREVPSVDDPNATFSAMFGLQQNATHERRSVADDVSRAGAQRDVASVLPQLKLLVQTRLQRSSASVEEVVDNAATDHQTVGWLSDRVRVMTMRGFLRSTFDQLADDMLALARRDAG
jgi:hypothetical protein